MFDNSLFIRRPRASYYSILFFYYLKFNNENQRVCFRGNMKLYCYLKKRKKGKIEGKKERNLASV